VGLVSLAALVIAATVTFGPVRAAPKPRDSVGAAIARIEAALRTRGCSPQLKALWHSAYGKANAKRCTYLRKGFGTFKSPRGLAYGTAAEIDAGTGYAVPATIVLTLDSDHRFHVVFIEFNYGSIGSKPASGFDRNARLAIDAIRRADCGGFLQVAFRSFGLGGGSDSAVCGRLARSSLHAALVASPGARPRKLGGNSQFAFYGLSAAGRYWTVVMSQQAPAANLPIDAARYAYVDAYPD
jgi:hypothetical protein